MAIQPVVAPGRLIARRKCVPAVVTHTSYIAPLSSGRNQDWDEFSFLEEVLEENPHLLQHRTTPWKMASLLKMHVDMVLEILNGLWPVVQPLPGHDLVGDYRLVALLDVIAAIRIKREGGRWRPLRGDRFGGAA